MCVLKDATCLFAEASLLSPYQQITALVGYVCFVKSDFTSSKILFLVEFYNAISLPVIFFEKSIPVWNTDLESIVWLGNKVFVSCADGSLMLFSPFSSYTRRFQVCASSILAIDYLFSSKMVLGTDSSEILVVDYKESQPDRDVDEPSIDIIKSIKLSSDERIICLATSKRNNLVAVGMLNAIRLFNLKNSKQINMVVPNVPSVATVIWSLVFVDDLLFSGDSRGKVTIHNTKTGGILKVIHSHQGAVLCLTTNGKSVFACGVDHRIQVIGGISSHEKRFDWATVGQRLFHQNDVRSMVCMGERWLVSGGGRTRFCDFGSSVDACSSYPKGMLKEKIKKCAEQSEMASGLFFVVAKSGVHFACVAKACSVAYQKNGLVLMRHPKFLELWSRQAIYEISTEAAETELLASDLKQSIVYHIDIESGPKKLAQINSSSYIHDSCISPDGNFVGMANETGLKVLCVDQKFVQMSKKQKCICTDVFIKNFWDSQSHNEDDDEDGSGSSLTTCLLATNSNLYYSEGEFAVRRLNFHQKSTELLGKKKNAGNILKMCVNPDESILVAISTNCQVLQIDLILTDAPLNDSMEEGLEMQIQSVKDLKFQYTAIECVFVSDCVVLFLCAELDSQLAFFDVSTQKCLKVLSKSDLQLRHNEFLCQLSDMVNDQVIAVSNKGKIRIFENLGKGTPVMHLKVKAEPKSFIANRKSDSWRKFGCRVEPFWGFQAALANKITKEKKRRSSESSSDKRNVLLIGNVAEGDPTTKPMKIKRYDRN